jgi:hypothetical protein
MRTRGSSPIHGGDNHDRGGKDTQVRFFDRGLCGLRTHRSETEIDQKRVGQIDLSDTSQLVGNQRGTTILGFFGTQRKVKLTPNQPVKPT